jgi:hypothetical protein
MTIFFESDDDEPTETDEIMRRREIDKRLRYAVRHQTVDAMIDRYEEYEAMGWLGSDR